MARLQFRVWDKYKKEMLYNHFIVRHGNDEWTQEFYDKYNKTWSEWSKNDPNWEPHRRLEYSHCHAEPLEDPDEEQLDYIRGAMRDGSAQYSLIDWSNFYFENYVTMQATGFHDKNGELIWEGDLLKFGTLIHPVCWYYSNFMWNGQMIADFREFDQYGNQIIQDHCSDSIAMALGYQGDIYGIQTENMEKVGNIYEHGEQYGFDRVSIEVFTPSYPL